VRLSRNATCFINVSKPREVGREEKEGGRERERKKRERD
jgi:hypothetical protein